MSYEVIFEQTAIAAAFARFAEALGVRDYGARQSHDGFQAHHHPQHIRDCIELHRFVAPGGKVLITVRPDNPLATEGLIVSDGQRRYLARSGRFQANTPAPELFRQNTSGDVRWIKAAGDTKKRYLITPLDGISDADLVMEVASFLTRRFVPNPSARTDG